MKIQQNKICVHCYPEIINSHHAVARVEKIFNTVFGTIAKPLIDSNVIKARTFFLKSEKHVIYTLVEFLSLVKIVKMVPVRNGRETSNRLLVIANEAKKRNYRVEAIKVFNLSTNIFRLKLDGGAILFHTLPTADFTENPTTDFDDKYKFKLFLQSHNLPYVPGQVFRNLQKALSYALELEFPLVVKPRVGSLSRHTTFNIKDENELRSAIKITRIISGEFIVEKYIEGENYRVSVVGNKMIACALREAPNITGDGVSTIGALIKRKNTDPQRGEGGQKNTTLHKIDTTLILVDFLKAQGYSLDTVPAEGRKVYLSNKVTLSSGADIHDVTDKVHPVNVLLFEHLSRLLEISLIGFDVITTDITKPYSLSADFAIIEANSAPFIDMHHFPVSGKARNVAAAILDNVEERCLKRSFKNVEVGLPPPEFREVTP